MLIKRVTNELVEKHKGELTKDFEKNKEIVEKLADVPSKKLRNIISGYTTRLIKNQKEL